MSQKKVVVAMSGGVDSSTVAAILKDAGHDVVGVTLQLYDHGAMLQKKGACCAGQDIYDAQMAAETIGIPHYVLNYESIFKQQVIDDFADSYLRGETPVPCVRCNQKVKFQDLFRVAKDLGADALATGHYVQKIMNDSNVAELHKGLDAKKDQSYFLFATTMAQLEYLMFPVGNITKNETRTLAKRYGLNIADKPDSQDICFVPEGGYAEVIKKLRPDAFISGNIVLKTGEVIGKHEGIFNYTIGQRKGINIGGYSEPLYVIEIRPETKEIVAGFKADLRSFTFYVKEMNWLKEFKAEENILECVVKVRSAHSGSRAAVYNIGNEYVKVELLGDEYVAVAPGQACVMYDGTRVLGGGWIVSGTPT